MKNKKQFTLIELIIVIVVVGILAAMALPKFNGVVRNAKISNMVNDKEVLEKTLILYYQKNDELPLLNEDQELIVSNQDISLSKIVLAEEATNNDMETIYKSLKETLTYYNDSEETLYRIDLPKIKDNLSKDIKYGHKKSDKDFYVYSIKTGNVYYYDYLVNGNGTIQHTEYDTLLKDNELIEKIKSPLLNEGISINENVTIQGDIIALGGSHSLKIGEDGNLYAWGYNYYGQLGIGTKNNQTRPQLVTLPNKEKPVSISAGHNHSMVITDKGNLYSWGKNDRGQLGIGNTIDQTTPQKVTIPTGEKPISIAVGSYHSMVITDKNNIYSWGYNGYGQLGIGTKSNQTTPQCVTLPNEEKPISISVGENHSIILTENGNLYSWGYNEFGQLGIGNKIDQTTPQQITMPNEEAPIFIAAGGGHSIVLTDKGNLYSFGYNNSGQLGIGTNASETIPKKVMSLNGETPIFINAGLYSTMAITKEGNLYSWGYNGYGQLGIGNTIAKSIPQKVNLTNKEKPTSISLNGNSSMIITNNKNIYSCGNNDYGKLGNNNLMHQYGFIKVDLP